MNNAGSHAFRRTNLVALVRPVYVPVFMLSMSWTLVEPVFPQYLATLGASLAVIGTVISMRGFGQLLSDLPGGVVLSRWGVSKVTVLSFAVAIVSGLGFLFVRSVIGVAVLVFATGLFTTVSITAFMTIVRLSVPADQRGRALSMAGGALRVGALAGPALGGILADTIGMQAVFAARVVVLIVGVVSFLRSTVTLAGLPTPVSRSGADMVLAVRTGLQGRWFAVGTVGAAVLVLMWLRAARSVILPLWGAEIGLSATVIGSVMSAGAFVELLLFVPTGWIMDRFGRKASAGLCLGVFSIGLFVLCGSVGAVGFAVATLVIAFGNGFGAGINMTLGTDLAPAGAVAEFLGVWRLYGDAGVTTGPIAIGAVAGAFSLATAVAGAGALGIVGLVVMVFLAPETLKIARMDGTG